MKDLTFKAFTILIHIQLSEKSVGGCDKKKSERTNKCECSSLYAWDMVRELEHMMEKMNVIWI
jgi:hypothetical protein